MRTRGVVIPASPLGKIKMVSQVVAILQAKPGQAAAAGAGGVKERTLKGDGG